MLTEPFFNQIWFIAEVNPSSDANANCVKSSKTIFLSRFEQVQQIAEPARRVDRTALFPRIVEADQRYEIEDIARFEEQPSIHIGLARAEIGRKDDVTRHAGIGEADRDVREALRGHTICARTALVIDDGKCALAEGTSDEAFK